MESSLLLNLVKEVVGFTGDIAFNTSKPDGTPRKMLDVSKINALGWRHKTSLEEGLQKTYKWFVDNYESVRK